MDTTNDTPTESTATLFQRIAAFLRDYCAFPNPAYADVLALWAIGTWVYKTFDAFPYLVITAATKRSGKTRLAEVLNMVSFNGKAFAAMTPATMFRIMGDSAGVTIFFDEAEELSSDAAGVMRSVLNVGYRRGQSIPRTDINGNVKEFQVYCPKVFILIGDVHDTLRDRSIVIELVRGVPPVAFKWAEATARAEELRRDIEAWKATTGSYFADPDTSFLEGREEEIWTPILALAMACGLTPQEQKTVIRAAVDLSADKTADAKRYVELKQSEDEARDEQYAVRALRDLHAILDGHARIFTDDAITQLKDIDTAPWRKYRGEGLTPIMLANMLSRFGVKPRLIKLRNKTMRGYQAADVTRGMTKLGKAVL